MRTTIFAAAVMCVTGVLLAQGAKDGDVESKTNPGLLYRLSKSFDGAITADDFEGKDPDPKTWEIRTTDELKVFFEGGTLHIRGVWPKNPGSTGGMIGAFSKPGNNPRAKGVLNAVMAARVKFNHEWQQEGFDRSPTMEFHFCGTGPDINMSIGRSFRQGKTVWGFGGGGGLGGTKKLPASQPDLAAIAALDDHQWQTLFTFQRGDLASGYILGPDGKWLFVGWGTTWLNSKRIELKLLHGTPGYKCDVEFDDARLYPHPADNPVRVAVYVHDSNDPRKSWPFQVRIVSEDSKRVLAEGTGGPGGDLFDLTLPPDVLYPVAAKIQIIRGGPEGGLDAELPIEQKGVRGLYPGDIWEVYCVPPKRLEAGGSRPTTRSESSQSPPALHPAESLSVHPAQHGAAPQP